MGTGGIQIAGVQCMFNVLENALKQKGEARRETKNECKSEHVNFSECPERCPYFDKHCKNAWDIQKRRPPNFRPPPSVMVNVTRVGPEGNL